MTERLNCSNCGAPVTRTGRETRVTCTHCQNVTEFPALAPPAGRASQRSDDDDDDDSGGGGRGGIPNIVIIQAPPMAMQQAAAPPPQRILVQGPGMSGPSVVNRPIVIVRRSSPVRIVGPIFFILLFIGVSTYIRMRATHAVESAEKGAEHEEKAAERGGEKGGEKKPPGHH